MRPLLDWEAGKGPWPAPWMVRVRWQTEDGTAVPVAVELSSPHGQPVTAEAWRSVRVADVIDRTRGDLRGLLGLSAAVSVMVEDPQQGARLRSSSQAFTPPRKPGRPPVYADEHFERVAEVYNAAVAASDPHPVERVRQVLSAELGVEHLGTAPRGWVRTARKRGLLTDRRTHRA